MGAAASETQNDANPFGPDAPSSGCCDCTSSSGIRSLLRSTCEESGGEYALLWVFCGSKLCVAGAWAEENCEAAKQFAAGSCSVMLAPGEGHIGEAYRVGGMIFNTDVRMLPPGRFARADLAKQFGIQSVMAMPLGSRAVLEMGSCVAWCDPPLPPPAALAARATAPDACAKPRDEGANADGDIALWAATLWKRSRHVGAWRQRLVWLTDAGGAFRLSSWDASTARLTDYYFLDRDSAGTTEAALNVCKAFGFDAALELPGGLVLAADSAKGAAALKELAVLLEGPRAGDGGMEPPSEAATLKPTASVKEDAARLRSRSSSTSTSSTQASSPQRAPLPVSDDCDLTPVEIDFGTASEESEVDTPRGAEEPAKPPTWPPACGGCEEGVARGKLLLQPAGGGEASRWLCKECFVTAWPQALSGVDDGRLVARPQWQIITTNGELKDATPPDARRYTRVCRR